ncbi:MAG: hypothetical protein WBQ60_07945 [Asticcacaulis sp.]
MIIPFEDHQNPWVLTHGLSSTDCGLIAEHRIDKLRVVGRGRFAYDLNVAGNFPAAVGDHYVMAWRPHTPAPPSAILGASDAREMAQSIANTLAETGCSFGRAA